jgi:hypothetical protein
MARKYSIQRDRNFVNVHEHFALLGETTDAETFIPFGPNRFPRRKKLHQEGKEAGFCQVWSQSAAMQLERSALARFGILV